MNRTSLYTVFAIFLLCLATACRSAKDTGKPESGHSGQLIHTGQAYSPQSVIDNELEWNDLTISGNMALNLGSNLSSAIQLRMVKGKSISISIRPVLGIEMGKIFISEDSIIVVDKYHKAFFAESIRQFMGDYVCLASLQQLLLSRPFIPGKGAITDAGMFDSSPCDENGNWRMTPKKQDSRYAYLFDMSGNNVQRFSLSVPQTGSDSYSMEFREYMPASSGFIATELYAEIPISAKIARLRFLFKSVKWDTGAADGIQIPRNAQRLSFSDISNLLSQQ